MRKAALALVVLLVASCDSGTFDPFDNDERYFTVYGFVAERELDHKVRVIPVTRLAEAIDDPAHPQASIDAVVTSTDLRDGTVTRWGHRLERFADGSYGHVFRGRFLPQPGRTYRLEITRNDGTVASAETTIPRFPFTVPEPERLFFPYEVSMDSALVQDVELPGIVSPWDMHMVYDLQGTFYRIPYGRTGVRTEDGWRVTVDLVRDARSIREVYGLAPDAELPLLHAMTLQVRALGDEWDPPRGEFDPEVLAQPGILSNVDKGYGIWSSIASFQYTWIAPPTAANR